LKIDPEAFDEWKAHPFTEALIKYAFASWEAQAKSHWVTASWDGEKADPVLLARMRERANLFRELQQLSPDMLQEALEWKPSR
jgi:hypothetical protein